MGVGQALALKTIAGKTASDVRHVFTGSYAFAFDDPQSIMSALGTSYSGSIWNITLESAVGPANVGVLRTLQLSLLASFAAAGDGFVVVAIDNTQVFLISLSALGDSQKAVTAILPIVCRINSTIQIGGISLGSANFPSVIASLAIFDTELPPVFISAN